MTEATTTLTRAVYQDLVDQFGFSASYESVMKQD
jgi:hypothetical protein